MLGTATLGLTAANSHAQDWSAGQKDLPATGAENRIIKWCESNGTAIRYSSANITVKGFEPCGTLSAQTSCDPAGAKFISRSSETPYSYRDCAVGPRLFVKGEKGEFGTEREKKRSHMADYSGGVPLSPLSVREKRSLEKEIRRISGQNSPDQMLLELESAMSKIICRKLGQKKESLSQEQLENQLRSMLHALGPGPRQALKSILGEDLYRQFVE